MIHLLYIRRNPTPKVANNREKIQYPHFFDDLFGGIMGNAYLCTQLYY